MAATVINARPNTAAVASGAAGASLALIIATTAPLVMKWEGKRNDPYWDIARVRTVCYGETKNVQERHYTDAECNLMLRDSLERHAKPILACLPTNLPLLMYASFISVGYNIGVTNFCSSSMAKNARAGKLEAACASISLWNKVRIWPAGKLVVSQGLVNRRKDERAWCQQGLTNDLKVSMTVTSNIAL